MDDLLRKSFVAGVERIAAWADLLDAINVYPVADGDTGRNLSISLSPLRLAGEEKNKIVRQLLLAARGNSGNIASQFFSVFYGMNSVSQMKAAVEAGRARAWKAVGNPRPGTMLSVFDALEDIFLGQDYTPDQPCADRIVNRLERAVHETRDRLPKLKKAGVVDAGALGMYIFFEGFFQVLAGRTNHYRPVTEVFKDSLTVSPSFQEEPESGYCVDFVVRTDKAHADVMNLAGTEQSAIVVQEGDLYKVHLHTDDKEKIRAKMSTLGSVMTWEDDNLSAQIRQFSGVSSSRLHIMTDAAGSLTRDDAKQHGFTLLNSYLHVGEKSLPETCFHPDDLYSAMSAGIKVSTSQASVFERHQFYASVLARFEKVLYLCVGSVFTGNYSVAMEWKKENDPDDRLWVVDTGAASGRLGTIVLAAQRVLSRTQNMEKTHAFVKQAVSDCEEYVFLDKLQYLAAGGRLSKTSAFFGDMLKMKPVISPQPEGAKKVGVVRNRKEQMELALAKMAASLSAADAALIMLEYSDNLAQVSAFQEEVQRLYPRADIILQPLSLTSGAHMGPGTWAVAFLPLATP